MLGPCRPWQAACSNRVSVLLHGVFLTQNNLYFSGCSHCTALRKDSLYSQCTFEPLGTVTGNFVEVIYLFSFLRAVAIIPEHCRMMCCEHTQTQLVKNSFKYKCIKKRKKHKLEYICAKSPFCD